ncbi:MAG: hypothetical protein K2X66_15130 [Cyanobacteria bacterium]|nr:hypothetical protein [Cyanobacteriota bacterium]
MSLLIFLAAHCRKLMMVMVLALIFQFSWQIFFPHQTLISPGFSNIWLAAIHWLQMPMHWVLERVHPFISHESITPWFPTSAAAPFAKAVGELMAKVPGLSKSGFPHAIQTFPYAKTFPGIIDWTFIFSGAFWFCIMEWAESILFSTSQWLLNLRK